jgi:predicted nucleic acid-binding protein
MKFLLDTNVFREIGKTQPDANVAGWLDTVDDAALAISALTVREVRKGTIRLHGRKREVADQIEMRVREVFDAFGERILPVTREVAELWENFLAHSDKHIDDTGLVATARVYGLTLLTRNLGHVSGRGAATLNPFKSPPKITRP